MPGPPAADELEVTVLGPGRGECVVVHYGANEWLIADSFEGEGQHPALAYLSGLRVPPDRVKFIIATHWHDDHVLGLFDLFEACTGAKLVVSAVLDAAEVRRGIAGMPRSGIPGETNGVEMMQKTVKLASQRTDAIGEFALKPVAYDTILVDQVVNGITQRIGAVSPSAKAQYEAAKELGELLTTPLSRVKRPERNHSAVAIWVTVNEVSILLGADLERSNDNDLGWGPVTRSLVRADKKAVIVKVPHHGSVNGYDAAVWEELVAPFPILLLAPFHRGSVSLPTSEDVTRMRSGARAVLQAAPVRSPRPPHGRVTARKRLYPPTTGSEGWTYDIADPGFHYV